MLRTATVFNLVSLINCAVAQSHSIKVKWLEGAPDYFAGVTFGLPWPRGEHLANATTFTASGDAQLQSWVTAYWPDGSLKWTGHALAASDCPATEYTITASGSRNSTPSHSRRSNGIHVSDSSRDIVVNTGKVTATFPKSGSVLLSSLEAGNKVVGKNGRLILRSQTGTLDDGEDGKPTGIDYFSFVSKVTNVTVSEDSTARALVTVSGLHTSIGRDGAHDDWFPFTVRFYLYDNSEAIRIIHTIIYDGNTAKDFISGVGFRLDVPLAGEEYYNRHIRIAGVDGGLLHEAVQGITGLRRDPGADVRSGQYNGTLLPNASTWDQRVTTRLQWVPTWSDYRLSQLSPDGFNLQKRTKAGQSWVTIPGGTRSGGLAYLGGATVGGLALGLRDFWKKYPTGLDLSNAATETGSITLWLYSPQAGPMDLRPYHDGFGLNTYAKQLDALEITYEDYEGGYDTPHGIGRTNELYLYAFETTPSADKFSTLINHTNNPPVLIPEPEYIRDTKAIGAYWDVPGAVNSAEAQKIESNMDFLIKFYESQVEQRRWYGFWDHGDIFHTYDDDRHLWRYDIGDMRGTTQSSHPIYSFGGSFFAPVVRMRTASPMTKSDTEARKTFYYLSGGDERTGELAQEVLEVDKAFVLVDARRKVRDPSVIYKSDPRALLLDFGTDWAGLAQAYLIEWERRGPRWEEAQAKLLETIMTYPKLKNGFVTGEALYNSLTGAWAPPTIDPSNAGVVAVSDLSGVFGVLETIDQLVEHFGTEAQNTTGPFLDAFLDYCYYYGASKAEQRERYGSDFGDLDLKQGHSRYTAYVANHRNNATLVSRVWTEFLGAGCADGICPTAPWETEKVNGSRVLIPVDEATWVSTNTAALYGVAGFENLALVGAPDVSSVGRNGTAKGRV